MSKSLGKILRLRKNKPPAGFTLIEVLAAIVILGIVTAIAVPNMQSPVDTAREKADGANIQLLEGAVKQFKLDTGLTPADLGPLVAEPAGGIPGWDGPYLGSIPNSPGGKTYKVNPVNGKVSVQ